VQARSIYCYQ